MIATLGHGQIWWADLDNDKVRPVVILTRAPVAKRLKRVLVAPVTSTIRSIPTEVALSRATGIRQGSVANLDNSLLLDVDRLLELIGSVERHEWPGFCTAMQRVMGCPRS